MKSRIEIRKRNRQGATMLEYVILALCVGVLCTGAVFFLGGTLRGTGSRATNKVTGHEQSPNTTRKAPLPGVHVVEEP